jgi:hypothetical protein
LRRALALVLFASALAFGGAARAQEMGTDESETEPVATADVEETVGGDGIAELSAPTPNRVELIVLDTSGHGVSPVVPRFVTDRLRAKLAQMGYRVWDGPASHVAAQRAALPYPPSVVALDRAARIARVGRVVFSQVWAERGRYVVQIVVVSIDGTGPILGRVAADAQNLGDAIDALLDQRVPWSAAFNRAVAAQALAPGPLHVFTPSTRAPADRRASHRGAVALIGGPGIGTGDTRFYTFNLRARFELRFTRNLAASAVTGYVNLPGGGQRVHNIPFLGQLEYKIAIADLERLRVPIRFGMGYIPFNGPMVRASAGVNYELNDAWEIGADLIAPTFLSSPSAQHLAFELSLEVVRRFGPLARSGEP